MVRKSLVSFLVLSFVAVLFVGSYANVCLADGDASDDGGEPGQVDPGCGPVTPTPIILVLFWITVGAIAGIVAGIL
jgi:hypothetical protein